MMKLRLAYSLSPLLLLFVGACMAEGPGVGLANTRWALVSYGIPGAQTDVVAGSEITLEFGGNGEAGGSGGCNSYGASYEIRGTSISFGEIASTLRACLETGIMEQEQLFFAALQEARAYEVSGERLTIQYGDAQGQLNFVRDGSANP